MAKFNYTKVTYPFTMESEESYDYLKLPYEDNGGRRVLFVLDHVPTEDLHSGRLLSGETGDLLGNLVHHSRQIYAKGVKDFSWFAVNFNCFRTYGKTAEYIAEANEEFTERLKKIIVQYKPDVVVTFGKAPTKALIGDKIALGNGRYSHWLGLPIDVSVSHKLKSHKTQVVSNISLNTIVNSKGGEASIIGYMMRCLSNALQGHKFKVDGVALENHKSIVIDTVSKFDKLLDRLAEEPVVSIDTETKNLNRITNRLLTIQFAKCKDIGYFVPFYHKDTPFRARDLDYMKERLARYFEGENQNEYHVYTNASFDLNVLKSELGIYYYKNNLWDILGGQFAIDENLKALDLCIGEYYYSLLNLSVQYGFEGYLTAEFGKANRGSMETVDLTPAFVKYSTFDVVVPFAIHEQQKRLAASFGYKKYESVVKYEISDTIHAFSTMEHTGSKLDINYLFHLRTDSSPIKKVISEMSAKLLATPAAKKADRILRKKEGVPESKLFAGAQAILDKRNALVERTGKSGIASSLMNAVSSIAPTMLKLNKPDHKKLFFFKCLGLKPLAFGKDGTGKIDKGFQSAYKDVPEVAMYTELEKAKKLANAYVKSFIKMLGDSEDLQKDGRIRPRYHYLKVVTHRTSSSDPNLQQVPSRSELGKHIKRLFVAREGHLYIKVDYRVHEVRGWGLVSFDKAVAKLFQDAKNLRDEYRIHPTDELRKRLKYEADIHIVNAAYFFGVDVTEVDKPLRNDVKGVIFGLIYQMSLKSLAETLGRTLEFTTELVGNFTKRFPSGMGWIEKTKVFARKNFYVEAPDGIRRNLWGYILPESCENAKSIHGRNDRQAVNSPIQGMCSKFMMNGIRCLEENLFAITQKRGRRTEIYINNSVHDSLENEASYRDFILGLKVIEESLTKSVRKRVMDRHGFDFVVDVEIDFELGATLKHCDAWNFEVRQLDRIVMESLLVQRNELKHKIDVAEAYQTIFSRAKTSDAPKWMREQIANLNYEFTLTERSFIKEILDSGTATLAKGKALLEESESCKDDEAKAKMVKEAKGLIKDGDSNIKYAEELEEYRKQNMKRKSR